MVMSTSPPDAVAAVVPVDDRFGWEWVGRGFLVTEKPKAVRSTKLPPLGDGRLLEELLFRLLMMVPMVYSIGVLISIY